MHFGCRWGTGKRQKIAETLSPCVLAYLTHHQGKMRFDAIRCMLARSPRTPCAVLDRRPRSRDVPYEERRNRCEHAPRPPQR